MKREKVKDLFLIMCVAGYMHESECLWRPGYFSGWELLAIVSYPASHNLPSADLFLHILLCTLVTSRLLTVPSNSGTVVLGSLGKGGHAQDTSSVFKDIFYVHLVEPVNAELMDKEGQLCF